MYNDTSRRKGWIGIITSSHRLYFKIESDTSTLVAAYGVVFNTLFSDRSVPCRVICCALSEEPRGLQIMFTSYYC